VDARSRSGGSNRRCRRPPFGSPFMGHSPDILHSSWRVSGATDRAPTRARRSLGAGRRRFHASSRASGLRLRDGKRLSATAAAASAAERTVAVVSLGGPKCSKMLQNIQNVLNVLAGRNKGRLHAAQPLTSQPERRRARSRVQTFSTSSPDASTAAGTKYLPTWNSSRRANRHYLIVFLISFLFFEFICIRRNLL